MFGVWLPEGSTETELRMEKTGESTFSGVLTGEGVSDLRPEVGWGGGVGKLAPQFWYPSIKSAGRVWAT